MNGQSRPWRRRAAVALLLVLALYLVRAPLLTGAARWLDVGQPPRKTTYVLPLPGDQDTRPFVAAALVNVGLADKALVLKTEADPTVEDGLYPPTHVVTRRILELRGVDPELIELLEGESGSTFNDAQALGRFLQNHPEATVTVVTNHYHTRRTRWVFRQVLKDRMPHVHFVSAPTDYYDETTWWRSRRGTMTYLSEYCKFAVYRTGVYP